jgi:flagellar hook-length control protein FliK
MMGSAMAMLMGAGPSGANAAVGDGDGAAPAAADATTDFLAALVASVPAESTALLGAVGKAPLAAGEDPPDDATPVDVSALIAGMLQALAAPVNQAAPAGAAAPAAESAKAAGSGSGAIAPGSDAHQKAATILANLLEATAAAQSARRSDDTTAADPAAPQFTAALTDAATSAAPQPAPRADLRQLLQMLAPADQRSPAAAARSAPAATGTSTEVMPQTGQLPLRAAELAAAATAQSSAGQLPPESIPTARAVPADLPATASASTAASMAAQNFTAPAHAASAPGDAGTTLQAAVGTPRWADELGSRVMLMTLTGQHEGTLTLTPEHLGPVEVRVSVNQNSANVWFGAQHADTRAALTEALPRLRELFAGAGLALGSADVSQQAPGQRGQGAAAGRSSSADAASGVDGLESVSRPAPRRLALGLVDTYV